MSPSSAALQYSRRRKSQLVESIVASRWYCSHSRSLHLDGAVVIVIHACSHNAMTTMTGYTRWCHAVVIVQYSTRHSVDRQPLIDNSCWDRWIASLITLDAISSTGSKYWEGEMDGAVTRIDWQHDLLFTHSLTYSPTHSSPLNTSRSCCQRQCSRQ